jgi:multiple sugar transport system substrate-binding protein
VRRKAGIIVALASVGMLLAGCSASGQADSGDSGSSKKDSGTIRVLVANFPANNIGQGVFKQIVAEFHKSYPSVKVESDFVPYDGLNQKISTSLASGASYDVISAGIGWVQPLADLGAIQSLTKLGITESSLEKSVYPSFIPPMLWKDEVYAVPIVANPRVLAYSKSAFAKAGLDPSRAPQTLKELREDAKKLTVRDASGNITQAGFDFAAPPSNYRQQFVAFMGALGGHEFTDQKPTFDSDAGVKALEIMHGMITVDKSSVYGYQNSAQTSLVTTGEAAMGFTGPYVDCSTSGTGIGDKCDDLAYFALKDKATVQYLGGRVAAIGEGSKNTGAGLAMVKAFQNDKVQEAISKIDVGVPVAKSAGDSAFVKSNPAGSFAWKHLDKGVFEYGGASYLDFRAKFGPSLDKVILGKATARDTLDDLKKIADGDR